MIAAAVYCRISSDPAGLRAGVGRQEEDCRAEVERRGWAVADVYVDNDVSAYSGKRRPAYDRLLADLGAGKVGAVVTWAADRLHRSPKELEAFIDLVEATGAAVVTVKAGEVDLSTADGRLHARMLGSVARHESEKKSERVNRALRARAERGAPANTRHRAFGYTADGLDLVEEEAAAIRRAADDVLTGRRSLGAIAREWGRTVTGAKLILLSPRLAGLREFQGAIYEAAWPAILDRDTHAALVAVLTRRSTPAPPRRHLLTGLARCGSCGALLRSALESRSGALVYRCKAADCPRKVTRRMERLDAHVTAAVLGRLCEAGEVPATAQRAARAALEDVRRLEGRLEELTAAMEEDDAPVGALSQAYRGVEAKLAEARGRVEAVPVLGRTEWTVGAPGPGPFGAETPLHFDTRTGWEEWWTGASLADRRAVLDRTVAALRVHPTTKGRPRKGAPVEGVEIDWR